MSEVFDPTPEIVIAVNNIVSPLIEDSNSIILARMANRFDDLYQTLESLMAEKDALTTPVIATLGMEQRSAEEAQIILKEAEINAQTTRRGEDLELISYRVREVFNRADNGILPFWLPPLRRFFERLPNPLSSLIDEVNEKQANFERAKATFRSAEKRVEIELTPQISATRIKLGEIKNDLIDIWEPPLIEDYIEASRYVNIFISRAEEFAKAYAEKHCADDSWKGYYPGFKKNLEKEFPLIAKNARFVDREWKKYVASYALKDWQS